ncbi:low affinity iron permease family protein [Burkholderia multivorans]|uniref:low affinity iron permease family protein n=1 Tax=Burkholderia multivorans TaxID=87883 RepID=UPI000D00B91C|nr:low affinity iron permease family protein [Burkholderia multivorans]MBU9372453.1 low affinity iron permease family protein [Burkholderia multivorans]MDN7595752.1 low affinity iron permease family protein [Burkholderia multivorans]PRG00955.1 low affinity iron permease family protein [Burkholderia multivorans]PRH28273.1 low affinity iron permease family protein [Burkholderia multivorans]UQN71053.1 low affinity iron permease family protein [Burkholderia multivorans]
MREANDSSRVRPDAADHHGTDRASAPHPVTRAFERFASGVTAWAGSPIAFGSAVAVTLLWLVSGPLFHYSDAWQLVINTGTTIITFLMVFLLQRNQNRDSVALHLKLDELVAATRSASDRLIGIEDASEEELNQLAQAYMKLAKRAGTREGLEEDCARVRDMADAPRDAS